MSARKCGKRHRDVVSFMSGEGAILRCRWCHEVVPWGPANDTAEVMQEIEAAELVALIAPGANPLFASVRMPTALKRAAFRGDPFDEQFIVRLIEQGSMATPTIVWAYEIATLARAIYDHEDP